jgi:predicted lipoprotein with Yx(FWY)xxD motif
LKRVLILAAGTAALAVPAAAVAATTHPATIKLEKTKKGTILENSRGFTVYMFTRDKGGKNMCVKITGCSSVWPAVTVKGKPVAGPGIKAKLLGTTTLAHGVKQVTYAGHPLYTFADDGGPHMTGYIGVSEFGGHWYALTASGHEVK